MVDDALTERLRSNREAARMARALIEVMNGVLMTSDSERRGEKNRFVLFFAVG